MIQKIVETYQTSGLLFLGIFMLSFVFYILAQYVTKDKLGTVFFALAGLCAIGSLPVSIPLYVLILINSHRVTERYLKKLYTAYTVGRAEGAKRGREDLDYIMHLSRFKDFESWKHNKLRYAEMSEDDLRLALDDEWKDPAVRQLREILIAAVVILFIFLFFYCAGEIHPVEI